jgi:hypothetical protein
MSVPPVPNLTGNLQWDPYQQAWRPITGAYARRLQRGYSQGLSRTEARRGQSFRVPDEVARAFPNLVLSERQLTRLRSQLRSLGVRESEFESTFGFSLGYWYYLWANGVDDINRRVHESVQITPMSVQQQFANAYFTGHYEQWVENQIQDRLYNILQYRSFKGKYKALLNMDDRTLPVEWWYYH